MDKFAEMIKLIYNFKTISYLKTFAYFSLKLKYISMFKILTYL